MLPLLFYLFKLFTPAFTTASAFAAAFGRVLVALLDCEVAACWTMGGSDGIVAGFGVFGGLRHAA